MTLHVAAWNALEITKKTSFVSYLDIVFHETEKYRTDNEFIVHFRISPTFYFVFLAYWALMPVIPFGPVFETLHATAKCSKLWWQTLLYFNNFYGLETNQVTYYIHLK